MEVKKEPDRCRLCFLPVNNYFSIFEHPNTIEKLKQYFLDEVSDSDIYPKVICCPCWAKVETFHEFSEVVIASREQYLQQYLDNVVKAEAIEENVMPSIEPEIHREIVCVEPAQPIRMVVVEEEDGGMDLSESKIYYESADEQDFQDIANESDHGSSSIFVESDKPTEKKNKKNEDKKNEDKSNGVRVPWYIGEVLVEQRQQVIDQYADMKCELCTTIFKTFDDALAHYPSKHKVPKGYVRCCQMKFSVRSLWHSHIVWHLNPELFKCNVCGILKKTFNALAEHKTNHSDQTYTCDICQKSFIMFASLKRHIRDLHAAKIKFPCDKCDESFRMKKHLDAHKTSAHPVGLEGYEEDVRNTKINPSPDQMKAVMDSHFNMKCDLCDTVFDSLKAAVPHYLSKHDNPYGYLKCCNIRLRYSREVLDHIQWHIDPDTFKCRICKKETNGRANLLKHIKNHQNILKKEFYCNLCDKYFPRHYLYKYHIERAHKNIELPEAEKDDFLIDSDYIDASCDMCSEKAFTSLNAVKRHYLDAHNEKDGYIKCCKEKFKRIHLIRDHMEWHKNPNIFSCNLCKHCFTSRSKLSQHMILHTNKFTCNVCQQRFRGASHLNKHLERHKESRKKYICDICNKTYFNKRSFQTHFDRKHNKNKVISTESSAICEFCAKTFDSAQALKFHIKRIHSVDPQDRLKKFYCNICGGWYATKGILKTHKMMHTSGPQKCEQCGRISANSNALKSHIKHVHDAPDFKCHLCDKICKSKDSLKSHIGTHLNEKNYKCTFCDEHFIWRTNMYKHRKQMHEVEWRAEKAKKREAKMNP